MECFIIKEYNRGIEQQYFFTLALTEDFSKSKLVERWGLSWEKWAETGCECVKVKITEI